jgi:hypothetical protein
MWIILIIVFIVSYPNEIPTVSAHKIELVKVNPDEELYDYTIEFLKDCEGYRARPYKCLAGKATIGYGHRIYLYDTITYLTELQADSLLKLDFDECLTFVGERYSNLEFNKQIALAHFAFCCGINAMLEMYSDSNILDIDRYIYVSGIPNNFLYIIRKFEIDTWNNNPFKK